MTQAIAQERCPPKDSSAPAHPSDDVAHITAMRDEMRQLHRLTVLGTAAATIAHEYNNLMTPVVGYAKYAADSGDMELMKKALLLTLKQTAIACAMSDRVLGLATNESRPGRRVDVRQLVDDAVACLCRDLSKDGITLKVDVPNGLFVEAVAEQLQQVLFNLLINARAALHGRAGRIAVSATRTPDNCVSIAVRDTGKGIPAEWQERIFEPFFTSRDSNGGGRRCGAGLGLAICRDIVQENRGCIRVESEVGVGTTFTISLPAAPPPADSG